MHVDRSRKPKNPELILTDIKLAAWCRSFGSLLEFKETRTKLNTLQHTQMYGLSSPQVTGKYSQLSLPRTTLRSAECLINFAHTINFKRWTYKTHKLKFGPNQSISGRPSFFKRGQFCSVTPQYRQICYTTVHRNIMPSLKAIIYWWKSCNIVLPLRDVQN